MRIGLLVTIIGFGLVGGALVATERFWVLLAVIVGGLLISGWTSRQRAYRLAWLVAAGLAGLVGISLLTSGPGLHQPLAVATLALAAYPGWRYWRERDPSFPLFPAVCALYGLMFGLPALLPHEPYIRFVGLASDSYRFAQLLSLLGLVAFLVGYYGPARRILSAAAPRLTSPWSERRMKWVAVALLAVWFAVTLVGRLVELPVVVRGLLGAVQQTSTAAVAFIVVLHLRGRLSRASQVAFWGLILPLYVLIQLGSGVIAPLVRLAMIVGLLVIAVRRRVPWRAGLVTVVIAVLLLMFKLDFRAQTWQDPSGRTGAPLADALTFLGVLRDSLRDPDAALLAERLSGVAQRLDGRIVFAHVAEATPDTIPYWGGDTYRPLLYKPIPRVLMPDRPAEAWANPFGHRYGLLHARDYETSVNLPQVVEAYANFGPVGVVVVMALLGLIHAALRVSLLHHQAGNPGLVAGAVLGMALLNVESNVALVYGGLPYVVVALLALHGVARVRIPRPHPEHRFAGTRPAEPASFRPGPSPLEGDWPSPGGAALRCPSLPDGVR